MRSVLGVRGGRHRAKANRICNLGLALAQMTKTLDARRISPAWPDRWLESPMARSSAPRAAPGSASGGAPGFVASQTRAFAPEPTLQQGLVALVAGPARAPAATGRRSIARSAFNAHRRPAGTSRGPSRRSTAGRMRAVTCAIPVSEGPPHTSARRARV
jgi:hypothetical protein